MPERHSLLFRPRWGVERELPVKVSMPERHSLLFRLRSLRVMDTQRGVSMPERHSLLFRPPYHGRCHWWFDVSMPERHSLLFRLHLGIYRLRDIVFQCPSGIHCSSDPYPISANPGASKAPSGVYSRLMALTSSFYMGGNRNKNRYLP